MSEKIVGSTPKQDGFYMPAEFSPQAEVFMIWPEYIGNWRSKAKPAQQSYAEVARAISHFERVTMLASNEQYLSCRKALPPEIRVVEMSSNEAWCRDTGPTFLINGKGERRAVSWQFNGWGGEYDGLLPAWDKDDLIAQKLCELTNTNYYRTEDFVLEGGSFHTDGEGTVLTTEMCLLSAGRNPSMSKEDIEKMLMEYLGCEKVLWITDGIDPYETNGHIDDVACFVRPAEVCVIDTDDKNHPFYAAAKKAQAQLAEMTDARGRGLKIHKVCCPKKPVLMSGAQTIDNTHNPNPRKDGELCIASYCNYLICNNAVIVPQYDDENDALALRQIGEMFPEREIVGVKTREIVYGGGNIHCITQQMPLI